MQDTSLAAAALRSSSGAAASAAPSAAPADRWLGLLGLAPDRVHALRVRKRVPLGRSVVGEVGVATDLRSGAVTRHAAVTADLTINGRPVAAVRLTPSAVQASRAFNLSLPGISLLLRAVAGLHADGSPVFGVDVDSVSPPPLVAAAAAGLLAAGKPLAGAKRVQLVTVAVPGLYEPWVATAELRACVHKKKGSALTADVRELSFVLDV